MHFHALKEKSFCLYLAISLLLVLFLGGCSENDSNKAADGDADNPSEADVPESAEAEMEIEDAETAEEQEAPTPFRVAVISDTHLLPNYNNMRVGNFIAFAELVEGMDPKPAYVINTGDCIEDMLCLPDINCEDMPEILPFYRKLIEDNFSVPFRFLLGNHDNRFLDMFGGNEIPLAMWQKAFEGSPFYQGPYYSFDHSGFRFILLFGSDTAVDHETNDQAGFGTEQLAWLDELLSEGLPSLLFWHQMIDPRKEAEKEEPNAILEVIAAHSQNVKAVFAGHGHRFVRIEWQGVPFYETDSLKDKEGELLHHLIECDPVTGSISIVNADEIVYNDGI